MSFLHKLLAAALLCLAGAVPALANEVVLQSVHNNAFVRLHNGVLSATGNADNAVRLTMVRLQSGRVAFRDEDGRFIRAGVGHQTYLAPGGGQIGGWEMFETTQTRDGVALRSVQNGLYVELDPRGGALRATSSFYGTHAQYRIMGAPRRAPAPVVRERNRGVDWTGRWSQMWVASPNGNLHRPPAGSRPDFTISVNRDIEMTAGCNTVQGRLVVDGSRARIQSVTMTRVRCSNAPQGYEQGMAGAFNAVRSYENREGQIAFLDAGGRTVFQIGR
jgi:heat shock protein HslJ